MSRRTIDKVLISRNAIEQWLEIVKNKGAELGGLDPASIPDEQAEPLSTGELRLWVDVPGHDIELIIPANEWQWMPG